MCLSQKYESWFEELRSYRTRQVKHEPFQDFYVKERRGDITSVLVCSLLRLQPKLNRRACVKAFPERLIQPSLLRLMMPQRCLCSRLEQLGQHEPSKCENSQTGTEACPRLAAPSPGEEAVMAGSPAIAQA